MVFVEAGSDEVVEAVLLLLIHVLVDKSPPVIREGQEDILLWPVDLVSALVAEIFLVLVVELVHVLLTAWAAELLLPHASCRLLLS